MSHLVTFSRLAPGGLMRRGCKIPLACNVEAKTKERIRCIIAAEARVHDEISPNKPRKKIRSEPNWWRKQ